MLADLVIEREYVECTSSVIQALIMFKKLYPDHRTREIDRTIEKAVQFIENTQEADGSWYGPIKLKKKSVYLRPKACSKKKKKKKSKAKSMIRTSISFSYWQVRKLGSLLHICNMVCS